jgi:hypothetical protein
MLFLFLYLPRLSDVLGNGSLGPRELLPVVVTPFVFLLAEEGRKAWVRADPR